MFSKTSTQGFVFSGGVLTAPASSSLKAVPSVFGEIRHEQVPFEWTIPDFLSQNEIGLYSPDFPFSDRTWYLKLYPNRSEEQWLSICLFLKDTDYNAKKKDISLTFAVKQSDDGRLKWKETHMFHSGKPAYCGNERFLKRANLHKHKCLQSGALTIVIFMQENMQDCPTVNMNCLQTLSSDFQDLFLSKSLSDVTIKVRDAEFQAHRAILVARSSVFSSAFEHDMSEKTTGIIDIEDCDSNSFGDFLRYLYTRQIGDISLKNAISLYITADKYNVQELKSCCVTYIERNLAADNVCTVISLADKFEETGLLSSAETYFSQNYSEVLSTTDWESLFKSNFRLANQVLKKVVSKDETTKSNEN